MTIAADDVLAEADLDADYLAGMLNSHIQVLPDSIANTNAIRASILRIILKHLERRTPPIREADIADPTELRDAMAYGTLEQLYEHAMTGGGDGQRFYVLMEKYGKLFRTELNSLQITTSTNERARNQAPAIFRR